MNSFSAGIMSNRGREPQALPLTGKIKLPSDPCDRVALAHEKAVAIFTIAAIYERKNSPPAPVGNLKEHGLVPLSHVFRLKQIKIGKELYFALGVSLGFIQVNNLAVVQVRG